MKRTLFFILCCNCWLLLTSQTHKDTYYLGYATKVAEAQMYRQSALPNATHKKNNEAPNALLCKAFLELYNQTDNEAYFNYVKDYASRFISGNAVTSGGVQSTSLSRLAAMDYLFDLRAIDPNPLYTQTLLQLSHQLQHQPRTIDDIFLDSDNGGEVLSIDVLSWALTGSLRFAAAFYNDSLLDDLSDQLLLMDAHTLEIETALNCHYWRNEKKQKWNFDKMRSAFVWSVAQGAFTTAIVDILDYLPADHPNRDKLIETLQNQCAALLDAREGSTNLWAQVLNISSIRSNYPEFTGSSLYCYVFAKGAKKGYLPKEYLAEAYEIYEDICEHLVAYDRWGRILLTHCSPSIVVRNEAKNQGLSLYLSEKYQQDHLLAVGAFIRASLALAQSAEKVIKNTIDIAYLLPFQAGETLRDATMDRFTDFYVGALVAANNLQSPNQKIRIRAYDTYKGTGVIDKLISNGALDSVDVIVGPAYSAQVPTLLKYAQNKQKPLFIPFSSKVDGFEKSQYAYRFNPTFVEESDMFLEYLASKKERVHCVFVDGSDRVIPADVQYLRAKLVENGFSCDTTTLYYILCDSMFVDLKKNRENIIFLNSTKFADLKLQLPHLKRAMENYKITMYSRYSWQKETTSIPQVYPSVFKPINKSNAAYEKLFKQYFGYAHPVRHPRYDILGYDLTSYIIQACINANRQSSRLIDVLDMEFRGIQSDIHFGRKQPYGGYSNQMIYILNK